MLVLPFSKFVFMFISFKGTSRLQRWKREGRWQCRKMLGSPRPADHLDSTYTCLNNPENRQKTSRTDSPKPSVDERPTEEGRKGGEAVRSTRTGRREPGWKGGLPAKQSP